MNQEARVLRGKVFSALKEAKAFKEKNQLMQKEYEASTKVTI